MVKWCDSCGWGLCRGAESNPARGQFPADRMNEASVQGRSQKLKRCREQNGTVDMCVCQRLWDTGKYEPSDKKAGKWLGFYETGLYCEEEWVSLMGRHAMCPLSGYNCQTPSQMGPVDKGPNPHRELQSPEPWGSLRRHSAQASLETSWILHLHTSVCECVCQYLHTPESLFVFL